VVVSILVTTTVTEVWMRRMRMRLFSQQMTRALRICCLPSLLGKVSLPPHSSIGRTQSLYRCDQRCTITPTFRNCSIM
jgi:hypothetical protein